MVGGAGLRLASAVLVSFSVVAIGIQHSLKALQDKAFKPFCAVVL